MALNGELNAVKRYRVIMGGMPNLAYRDMVFNILSDELRHANLYDGILMALNGELNAVKRYRVIMGGMPNLAYRDMVFNILSDELRHANLYNYIYTTVLKR